MIEPLPTPEKLIGDTLELHPDDAVSMRELVQLVRADREAIAKTMDQMASSLEAVIHDPASDFAMLHSRGAVQVLRGLIAMLVPPS